MRKHRHGDGGDARCAASCLSSETAGTCVFSLTPCPGILIPAAAASRGAGPESPTTSLPLWLSRRSTVLFMLHRRALVCLKKYTLFPRKAFLPPLHPAVPRRSLAAPLQPNTTPHLYPRLGHLPESNRGTPGILCTPRAPADVRRFILTLHRHPCELQLAEQKRKKRS